MIAYNTSWLYNLFTRQQASDAFNQNYLAKEEVDRINNAFPVQFYSPNIFIRIGLFILTIVILLFTFGLLVLLFPDSLDHAIGILAIFFALVTYAALEYMVQTKRHLQSGVDDALLWVSAGSLFGGISYLSNAGDLTNCLIVFIISLYYSLRFADRIMGAVLYISLLGIVFFSAILLGISARSFIPFLIMAVSAVIYFLVMRIRRLDINHLYSNCLQVITIGALLSFYVAGNYFVVRELSNELFNLNLAENEHIPQGWMFWLFTSLIPCVYIIKGIQTKDSVLIRVGLLLLAAVVFTVRYYYAIVSVEVIMTTTGIILIVVSYILTRYLRIPKYGFTNLDISSTDTKEKLQLESLLQTQTLTRQSASPDGANFGGGQFGGGGASSDF